MAVEWDSYELARSMNNARIGIFEYTVAVPAA